VPLVYHSSLFQHLMKWIVEGPHSLTFYKMMWSVHIWVWKKHITFWIE
jgi:hypothetical protein